MKYFHFHFRFELNAIKRKVFFCFFFLYEFEYIKCNYIFYSQTSLRVLFFHLTWPLSVVSIGFSFLFVVCVFFLRVCVLLLVCVNVSQFLFRASIRPNRKKKSSTKNYSIQTKMFDFLLLHLYLSVDFMYRQVLKCTTTNVMFFWINRFSVVFSFPPFSPI